MVGVWKPAVVVDCRPYGMHKPWSFPSVNDLFKT